MTPLGSYTKGGKVRLETQITECSVEPFTGPRNHFHLIQFLKLKCFSI